MKRRLLFLFFLLALILTICADPNEFQMSHQEEGNNSLYIIKDDNLNGEITPNHQSDDSFSVEFITSTYKNKGIQKRHPH